MFINAQNGHITVIITMNSINNDIFYQDTKTNLLMAKQADGKSIDVNPGKYVRVTILSKQFNDMDTIIMAMGELNELVTDDEEIKKSYSEEYGVGSEKKYVNFEKYIEDKDKDKDINLQLEDPQIPEKKIKLKDGVNEEDVGMDPADEDKTDGTDTDSKDEEESDKIMEKKQEKLFKKESKKIKK
jgi:hypothetical protein